MYPARNGNNSMPSISFVAAILRGIYRSIFASYIELYTYVYYYDVMHHAVIEV